MHSSVIGYMLVELMFGQKLIMAIERTITSWMLVDWTDQMNIEEQLCARIRQLERQPQDMEQAKVR